MKLRGLLLAGALLTGTSTYGQGCTQCRDNAASTPPATQAAYRRAIGLMAIMAMSIFAGTIVVLKRLD